MKKLLVLVAALMSSFALAHGQNLAVNLTYTASGTVQLYRATATGTTCPAIASGAYDQITAVAPASGPFLDTVVTDGDSYCWYATQQIAGYSGPSGPSNIFGPLTVELSSANEPVPTGLTGTVVALGANGQPAELRPPAPVFGTPKKQ